jgi:hypothetical protein
LSFDRLRARERKLDLNARRLLRLLDESANDDDPLTDPGSVKGASYSISASQPQFPQLPHNMLRKRQSAGAW